MMEGEPSASTKGRKRAAASAPTERRARKQSKQGEDGEDGDGQPAAPLGPLVRQGTFTKDEDADSLTSKARQGRGAEQFYILVEDAGNADRREALRRRLAARAASRSQAKQQAKTEVARPARPAPRPRKSSSSTVRGGGSSSRRPCSAPPTPRVPPPLQRQGTFTVDEADGERHDGDPIDPGDDGDTEQAALDTPLLKAGASREVEGAWPPSREAASTRPDAGDDASLDTEGLESPGEEAAAAVTAVGDAEGPSPASVPELRAALAVLRRGRAVAQRAERATKERAARDAARTRLALQDLHVRLAATREALHSEKEALHRKLSADFRRALHDREALWRQERERAQTQVRTLETEVRSLRAQLHSAQSQAHADALRRATASEADLRRAMHDQEGALRAQMATLAKQRDSLQQQLRERQRAAHPASVRPVTEPRGRHSRLNPHQATRDTPATLEADLAEALRRNEEYQTELARARATQQALEDQLDALREQQDEGGRFTGKQMTLALESQGEGKGGDRKGESLGESGDNQTEEPPAGYGSDPHLTSSKPHRSSKRKRHDDDDDDDQRRRPNEPDDDEERRRLHVQVQRLQGVNAELQAALRLVSSRRRRGGRGSTRTSWTAGGGAQLHRVRRTRPPRPSVLKKNPAEGADPFRDTNAGGRGEEGPMRHFHRLISLEPVSEADEYPAGGEGVAGLEARLEGLGALGGPLMGSESPLSSGPSSLSPTPGIGDVWNDLAPACSPSSGGSGPSSGSSSPGGESLGESLGDSAEQLALSGLGASHPVLYWQLMRDHLQLQRAYQQLQQLQASSRSSDRQARAKLEAQVYDLKRALSRRSAPSGAALADALQDVVELRQREEALTAELAELRDQNELLEFRLLELEGIVDKSSVCSGTRDVCTDTESDTVTEDSGLLSLGASDDGEPIDSAVVRERLAFLASSMPAEEDRGCLQRALQLLDTYQQHLSKAGVAAAAPAAAKQPGQRIVATVLPFTEGSDDGADATDAADAKLSRREEFRRKQEFFNQMQRLSHHHLHHHHHHGNGSGGGKALKQGGDCLQESGIFEGDSEDSGVVDLAAKATQTDARWACSCHQEDAEQPPLAVEAEAPFSSLPPFGSPKKAPAQAAAGALSAEIQKLSQIRERIEEQGTVSKLKLPEATPTPPSGVATTQLQLKLRELEFFRSRAAALEAKLAELERCSDPELRGCARLLERVAALERQAKEAREAADLLVRRNRDLEEERCELEEAENDTRLRCQQLEVEVVQLREREGALEVELGRARRGLSAAHQLQGRLEMALQSLETRNFELEEAECELRASIAAVESALPAIIAFHLAHYRHYLQQRERAALPLPPTVRSVAVSTEDCLDFGTDLGDADMAADEDEHAVVPPPAAKRDDSEVLERLAQLVAAEKDMHQKIAFLEQKESAFQETLAAADGLWTEMELNYKRRLARAEEAEEELRRKVRRLEDSECKLRQAVSEQSALSERVAELEVQERALVSRIRTLEQDKQAAVEETGRRHEELRGARAALAALQDRVQGPLAEELAAERRRAEDLAEELRGRQDALTALEQRTNTEISALQTQIAAGEKTLQDMEVTCAELREEVDTLEEAVAALRGQLAAAHDQAERHLFQMESALADRDRLLDQLRLHELHEQGGPHRHAQALHHEMALAASRQPEEDDDATAVAAPAPTPPTPPTPPTVPPAVSLFRKSLQAFRTCELMASKPPTPPKPVPKKEVAAGPASLPAMPVARRPPPPLPPKTVAVAAVASLKRPRVDSSSPSGS